jgi:hypothetical protein
MLAKIRAAAAKMKWLIVAALVFLGLSLGMLVNPLKTYSQAVPGYCDAPYKVNWPTDNPVWSLCWKPPSDSSGINGSGLELNYVFYKGKEVFHRAHLPVLNVTYDPVPGACGGGPDRSYRDWQNEMVRFEANNELQPGYAEPTLPPRTVCNVPGADLGSFTGVAVEKRSDRLVLTTQMPAGWYRYTQKWNFYANGDIQPSFGFSAVEHPCISKPHVHHAYWRFDFDVEGSGNDRIDEYNNGAWATKTTEFNGTKAFNLLGTPRKRWRVIEQSTNRGYEVIPRRIDGVADTPFAVSDVWGLAYGGTEIDDGGSIAGSDRAQMNSYINGQSVNGQDIVFWYRAGYRHGSGATCQYVGPTLRPVGNW